MRFTRKLMLLALAAVAAMALGASSASATAPIEIVKENETHCPTLAKGGCLVHQEGEATLFFHLIGFEGVEAECHVEYRGRTDEDGNGQVTLQTVTPGGHDAECSNATAPACTGSLPWPGTSEFAADAEPNVAGAQPGVVAHYDVCIDPAESGTCSGEYITHVSETSAGGIERQHQSASDLKIGSTSFCEVTIDVEGETSAVAGEHEFVHIRGN